MILRCMEVGVLSLFPQGSFRHDLSCDRSKITGSNIGGEAGIRTLGGANLAGFQDHCFLPLSHIDRDFKLPKHAPEQTVRQRTCSQNSDTISNANPNDHSMESHIFGIQTASSF